MSLGRTAGRILREVVRLGYDRVAPGAVPRRAAEVTSAALAELLGAPVGSVVPVGGSSGTTDRSVLRIEGPGDPRNVFLKTAALDPGTRLFGGLARLGEVEVGFYRDLRPGLDLEAPRALGSRFDPRTGRFAIVLEDLTTRGARFVDTVTPLGVDQVAAALTTLAALHGQTSEPAGVARNSLPWLTTNSGDPLLPVVSALLPRLERAVAERTPGLLAPGGSRLLTSYRRWAPVLDRDAFCVLHGDPHPGNLYLLPDRVGLLDWQAVRRGHGLRDATYLIVLSLEPDVRRGAERDLLAHYGAALASYGGPRFGPDALWSGYRRMAAYVYVATTFTAGLGGLQGDAIADAGLGRSAVAVADLEVLDALQAHLP